MFDQQDGSSTLFPDQVSIDVDASHGAWLRDFESGREFLDFSGRWSGWALGHGLKGYRWPDFVGDVLATASSKLYFQLNASPRFECEVVKTVPELCFWSPSLEEGNAISSSSAKLNIIGLPHQADAEWVSESWVKRALEASQNQEMPIYLNETKTFLGGFQPLLLAYGPWSMANGSVVFLSDDQLLIFRANSSNCDMGQSKDFNIADLLTGKLSVRSETESKALEDYFHRIFEESLANIEGLEVVGRRGLSMWCQTSSLELRDAIVNAAYDEGLLLGYSGAETLSFHVPYQVKADAIGRAAAQLEAGLIKTMEKMNRWLK